MGGVLRGFGGVALAEIVLVCGSMLRTFGFARSLRFSDLLVVFAPFMATHRFQLSLWDFCAGTFAIVRCHHRSHREFAVAPSYFDVSFAGGNLRFGFRGFGAWSS